MWIRILLVPLMRIRSRIPLVPLLWIRILSFNFDADPDPSFQIKAQNLEKVLIFADIPNTLPFHPQIDVDPDPTFQFNANTCGSGSGSATRSLCLN
jgi:hypothetical protein